MQGFKIFDTYKLQRDESLEDHITKWMNEKPRKIIQINQSIDIEEGLIISIFYSED